MSLNNIVYQLPPIYNNLALLQSHSCMMMIDISYHHKLESHWQYLPTYQVTNFMKSTKDEISNTVVFLFLKSLLSIVELESSPSVVKLTTTK